MPDPTERLNAALEGRYSIERELGEGGMASWVSFLKVASAPRDRTRSRNPPTRLPSLQFRDIRRGRLQYDGLGS